VEVLVSQRGLTPLTTTGRTYRVYARLTERNWVDSWAKEIPLSCQHSKRPKVQGGTNLCVTRVPDSSLRSQGTAPGRPDIGFARCPACAQAGRDRSGDNLAIAG